MEKEIMTTIINEALGEASALFMSQEVKGTEIIMPSRELLALAERTVNKLSSTS